MRSHGRGSWEIRRLQCGLEHTDETTNEATMQFPMIHPALTLRAARKGPARTSVG